MTDTTHESGAYAAAMDTLRSHQEEARAELLAGFESRADTLLWQHRCAALTIGQLPDDWFERVIDDRWLCAALLDDSEKRATICAGDSAPDRELCLSKRYDIIQDDLTPAFQQALTVARKLAADYAESGDRPPVASNQQYIFMRPKLHELVENQREVLAWALGKTDGLDGREPIRGRAGVLEWATEVTFATNGFIGSEFAPRLANPNSEWWVPLTQTRGPTLELKLAATVLPRCNRALRDASESAQEQPSEQYDPLEPIQG